MATDIGPDMLRNLDAQLEAATLDRAGYESRRAEVLESIRRGGAIEYSAAERLRRAGRGLFLLLAGVCLGFARAVFRTSEGDGPAGLSLFGLLLAVVGAAWRRWRE